MTLMRNQHGPDTVRPGAKMSKEAYQDLIRSTSTIPPAPKTPVPLVRGPKEIFDECEQLIFQTFSGRQELLKVVRTGGSVTVVVNKDRKPLGRIIVSHRFGTETFNVWVQHPTSETASCQDVAYLAKVAQLMNDLSPKLKTLIAGG